MRARHPVSGSPTYWLLIASVAVTLVGCRGNQSETATAPPSGGPSSGSGAGATTGTTDAADRTASEAVSDVAMTAKVKNALMLSKVDTGKLNVDTREGVVTLKGSVPTAAQKSLAEKVAKQVEGVTSVKNSLTVGAGK